MTPALQSLRETLLQMAAWASALRSEPAPEVVNSIHRAGIALASQLSTQLNEHKKETHKKETH